MKAAPVSRAFSCITSVDEFLTQRGQHHNLVMSEHQFKALGLRAADINLGIHGGAPSDALGRILRALDPVISDLAPHLVNRLSSLLFVPTSTGVRNLGREGITDGVEFVGDVALDALLQILLDFLPARGRHRRRHRVCRFDPSPGSADGHRP